MPGAMIVTGTGTGVGKTVVTAALAALAHDRWVAVLKPAQTGVAEGEPGDLAEIIRLAGPITTVELARYPDPLAPRTAARRAGLAPVTANEIVGAVDALTRDHDLVLVEGAGGLLVQYDEEGSTLADVARLLRAPVLVVAQSGLGVLNTAALTGEALRARGVACGGVVIGSWPDQPDLASRCNLAEIADVIDAPLLGAVPEAAANSDQRAFGALARRALAPELGGTWCLDARPTETSDGLAERC